MIISGKVENRQTTQGLALFCFFSSKILFLSCLFFPINLKTLSSVFLIFHSFSPITGSYFCDWDVIIEFQIHSASKITHLQVHCTDFYYKDTFAGIGNQVESMIKAGRVENWQATQGLASFCFFHQSICFFLACFFPINLKTFSPVFLISHSFSPITGSYFYHCDVIMQIQNWCLCDSVFWKVSPNWNTFFVKRWVKYINDS